MTTASEEHVVIIGAGIIGIACAHYIQKLGHKVTVIDKGTVAGACSHGNCGQILPSHILPLNDPAAIKTAFLSLFDREAAFMVKPRLSTPFMKWMWNFTRHCTESHKTKAAASLFAILHSSYHEYEALMQGDTFPCEWKKSGSLYLYKNEAEFQKFEQVNAWCSEHHDITAEQISGDQLTSLDPALTDNLAGGYFYPDDACLRPDQLAREWVNRLKAGGVNFMEHCTFERLEAKNGHITTIETSQGVLETDHVVLAAGAMSETLAKQFQSSIPMEPGKGYAVSLERPQSCPEVSLILPEQNIAVTSFSDQLRLGSIMEFVGYDHSIPEYRMQQLIERVRPYLKSDLHEPVIEKWYGWRPMTWDSLPIIGRSAAHKNAYFATGHNMIGMMSAPATGKLITELLSGQSTHIDATPFSPARFN